MRGTRSSSELGHSKNRFIPAYAGNAHSILPVGRRRAVHPRVCGERSWASAKPVVAFGSSPRMRGTPRTLAEGSRLYRFIPAYAGNAPCLSHLDDGLSVHPRVCGEREYTLGLALLLGGSSPRMRGTRFLARGKHGKLRFIPAYAGNAPTRPLSLSLNAVHPRVCGERLYYGCSDKRFVGSSPRMRGTLFHGATDTAIYQVHPRVCGERPQSLAHASAVAGSSPRMRGTRFDGAVLHDGIRFIPAYAGNAKACSQTTRC